MHRGSETKFPWWYFFTQGGFWLANEQQLPFTQRKFSLSLSLPFSFPLISNPSFSHYHSLFSPLWHLPNICLIIQHAQSAQVWGGLGPGGRAVLRVTRRSGVHTVRARFQNALSYVLAGRTLISPDEQVIHNYSEKIPYTLKSENCERWWWT